MIQVVPGTYAKLSDIKSGRDFVLNTSSFAVVVVEIGKVNKPRRPNDRKDLSLVLEKKKVVRILIQKKVREQLIVQDSK